VIRKVKIHKKIRNYSLLIEHMPVLLDDFLLLRKNLPVVDVRSPLEFSEGHMRGAINIPLLNNEERVQVGTDYKKKGQKEAIKTGFRLVGPRLLDIVNETEKIGKEILVHCWRGGMRSNNFSQFVAMAGVKSQTLTGGYKSYRQQAVKSFSEPFQFRIIGGCTGSGKSEILRALGQQGAQIIDLEAMAHHRGSAFGGLMMPPQPTTEQFQNELFEEILKLDITRPVWIEDESIAIGKIFLPNELWQTMSKSPVIEMGVSKGTRIQRLVDEYGPADKEEFLAAMSNIVKKLGGQHFNTAKEKLFQGDMASVIEILLTYYDKAYQNGLERKKARIKHRLEWDGTGVEEFATQMLKEVK
jgi:tRNA 2-selenouridine synthase